MEKEYAAPKIDIVTLECTDVITISTPETPLPEDPFGDLSL